MLDVLLDRPPFSGVAARLFAKVEIGDASGVLGATTVTTIHYLLAKALGRQKAIANVRKLLLLFEVAPVDRIVLELASNSAIVDFEDAVLHEAGRQAEVDVVVTRNVDDFKGASLVIQTPEAVEAALATTTKPPPH